jgi:hypothetical protein
VKRVCSSGAKESASELDSAGVSFVTETIRNWTGAWAENDIFQMLSAGALSSSEWIQVDRQFKAIVRASPRLIRPRYAQANLGHPSSSSWFLLRDSRRF